MGKTAFAKRGNMGGIGSDPAEISSAEIYMEA